MSAKGRIAAVVHAAENDTHRRSALRFALGQIRRQLGVNLDDLTNNDGSDISLQKLNAAMSERKLDVSARMRLKEVMYAAGFLDA